MSEPAKMTDPFTITLTGIFSSAAPTFATLHCPKRRRRKPSYVRRLARRAEARAAQAEAKRQRWLFWEGAWRCGPPRLVFRCEP